MQRSRKQESKEILTHTERSGRNRWITIGAVVLVAIVIGFIFVARQLPPTPQGYQAFFTAFAGVAALGTGVALAVFVYQQYKLRQTEHRLLFEPQILLNSVNPDLPNSIFCFKEINPYSLSTHIMIIMGNFRRTAVSSSCIFIRKDPSPHIATTFFSGNTNWAAIAPGRENPMEQNPLGIMHVFGSKVS